MRLILSMMRTAWAMPERAMKVGIAALTRDQFFAAERREALESRNGAPLKNAKNANVRDGVAVIPIAGVLFRRADAFEEMCGGASATYGALRKDLQAALDDPQVKAILLDIDSPGGEVDGCGELADAIFQARGQKPIVSYVGGMGASAAYWLASAADKVVCAPTAELGSIGVRSGYIDDRKALESMGFKEWVFVSSQSPKKAFDPEVDGDRARLQVVLDDLADVFIGAVARHRGITAKKVQEKFGQGDVMVGARAVEAGLADELGDFELVLAELASRRSQGAYTMTMKAKLGLPEDSTTEQVEAAATARIDAHANLLQVLGAANDAEARAKALAGTEALAELGGVRADLAKERTAGIARDLRATLEKGLDDKRLSLGRIQKSIPVVLRGEQKAAWIAAMSKTDDKGELLPITRQSVLDAACSVAISADDLEAIGEYAKAADQTAAETVREPSRTDARDGAELDGLGGEIAEGFGIELESVKKYGGVRNADDLKKTQARTAAQKEG